VSADDEISVDYKQGRGVVYDDDCDTKMFRLGHWHGTCIGSYLHSRLAETSRSPEWKQLTARGDWTLVDLTYSVGPVCSALKEAMPMLWWRDQTALLLMRV
jgi:hypothetical protein